MSLQPIISMDDLIQLRKQWKRDRFSVGLVATMGALHEGHLSLVRKANEFVDKVIVTIFVNPKQFGPNEDFSKYPRTLKDDMALLEDLNVDAVFIPNAAEMYPASFQSNIVSTFFSQGLCGAERQGHFDGVLTVVNKLFNVTDADYAFFGKKDYQQFKVLEAMVRDLNMDIKLVACEIIRESDGLALSSRNRFLSEDHRQQALALSKALQQVGEMLAGGEREIKELKSDCLGIIHESKDLEVEYLEFRGEDNFEVISELINRDALLLVAAKIGSTRLIDNIELRNE